MKPKSDETIRKRKETIIILRSPIRRNDPVKVENSTPKICPKLPETYVRNCLDTQTEFSLHPDGENAFPVN